MIDDGHSCRKWQVEEVSIEGAMIDDGHGNINANDWDLSGVSLSNGVATSNVNGGSSDYMRTLATYSRPLTVTFKARKAAGSDECVAFQIFPQSSARHTGYNFGFGWWAHYQGAGIDGSIDRYGADGTISDFQEYKAVLTTDTVTFYRNGQEFWSRADNRYQSGQIMIGHSCRKWQVEE